MDHVLNIDLQQLVTSASYSALEDYAHLYQIEALERWVDLDHGDIERFLRLSEQKISRAKRPIEHADELCQSAFFLGVTAGIVAILRELYREEKKDQQITAMCAAQTDKTDQILLCIANQNGGQGMRHGELADAVGIPYSSLTNIMKRILQSKAVTVTRIGKNAYYTLTRAGRRYCERKRGQPDTATLKNVADQLREIAEQVERGSYSEQIPEVAIHAGEGVEFITQDMTTTAQLKILAIMETPHKKFAICEDIDQTPRVGWGDTDHLEEFKWRSWILKVRLSEIFEHKGENFHGFSDI